MYLRGIPSDRSGANESECEMTRCGGRTREGDFSGCGNGKTVYMRWE